MFIKYSSSHRFLSTLSSNVGPCLCSGLVDCVLSSAAAADTLILLSLLKQLWRHYHCCIFIYTNIISWPPTPAQHPTTQFLFSFFVSWHLFSKHSCCCIRYSDSYYQQQTLYKKVFKCYHTLLAVDLYTTSRHISVSASRCRLCICASWLAT